MDHRPTWYTADTDSAWERVKMAFRNDWDQTKHDFGSKTTPDLGQDVDNTVKQAAGTEDAFAKHEQAFRFGYGAQRQYRAQYPTWNSDLETKLRDDYGTGYELDRDYIRRAYEYRPSTGTSLGDEQRGENRP